MSNGTKSSEGEVDNSEEVRVLRETLAKLQTKVDDLPTSKDVSIVSDNLSALSKDTGLLQTTIDKLVLNEDAKIPLAATRFLLDLVKAHEKEIDWLLERHGALRTEYLTFFKKDLKEIFTNLQGVYPVDSVRKETPERKDETRLTGLLEDIVTQYSNDIQRSFQMIDARYIAMIMDDSDSESTNDSESTKKQK